MKKIFCTWGFTIALLLICAQVLFCQTVSVTDAKTVAINFMKAENPQAQILDSRDQAMGAENQDGALVYVFNFQPGGFVLVASDLKSTPILGFSEKNNFDLEHLNPEAKFYLSEMESQISVVKATKNIAPMRATWNKFLKSSGLNGAESETIVGPYLTTQWGQGQYYNQFCPTDNTGPASHVLTGCVATALAQVIKYHNSPAYGMGDHGYQHAKYGWQEADFENTPYNWNNMPNQLSANNSDVATLLYHCGVAVNMNYGPSVSLALVSNIAPALQNHFRFSSTTMAIVEYAASPQTFSTAVVTDLDLARPVLMSGFSAQAGHTWVCDGYKIITNVPMYYHMNWGWDGSSNGYFQMGNFNTYNSALSAVTGIEPACPRNVNLTTLPEASLPLEVTQTITVNVPVIPFIPAFGDHVDYDAGKSVLMNPGFIADGSIVIFRAFIQGCGGTIPFTQVSEDRAEEGSSVVNPTKTSVDLNAYPNPFTSSTIIAYTLPVDQEVDVQIFNALGNLVAQPVRQEQQTAGLHEYNFEANGLPTGVYFIVMQTDGQKMTKRIVLSR